MSGRSIDIGTFSNTLQLTGPGGTVTRTVRTFFGPVRAGARNRVDIAEVTGTAVGASLAIRAMDPYDSIDPEAILDAVTSVTYVLSGTNELQVLPGAYLYALDTLTHLPSERIARSVIRGDAGDGSFSAVIPLPFSEIFGEFKFRRAGQSAITIDVNLSPSGLPRLPAAVRQPNPFYDATKAALVEVGPDEMSARYTQLVRLGLTPGTIVSTTLIDARASAVLEQSYPGPLIYPRVHVGNGSRKYNLYEPLGDPLGAFASPTAALVMRRMHAYTMKMGAGGTVKQAVLLNENFSSASPVWSGDAYTSDFIETTNSGVPVDIKVRVDPYAAPFASAQFNLRMDNATLVVDAITPEPSTPYAVSSDGRVLSLGNFMRVYAADSIPSGATYQFTVSIEEATYEAYIEPDGAAGADANPLVVGDAFDYGDAATAKWAASTARPQTTAGSVQWPRPQWLSASAPWGTNGNLLPWGAVARAASEHWVSSAVPGDIPIGHVLAVPSGDAVFATGNYDAVHGMLDVEDAPKWRAVTLNGAATPPHFALQAHGITYRLPEYLEIGRVYEIDCDLTAADGRVLVLRGESRPGEHYFADGAALSSFDSVTNKLTINLVDREPQTARWGWDTPVAQSGGVLGAACEIVAEAATHAIGLFAPLFSPAPDGPLFGHGPRGPETLPVLSPDTGFPVPASVPVNAMSALVDFTAPESPGDGGRPVSVQMRPYEIRVSPGQRTVSMLIERRHRVRDVWFLYIPAGEGLASLSAPDAKPFFSRMVARAKDIVLDDGDAAYYGMTVPFRRYSRVHEKRSVYVFSPSPGSRADFADVKGASRGFDTVVQPILMTWELNGDIDGTIHVFVRSENALLTASGGATWAHI